MHFNPDAKCSPTLTSCPRCGNDVKLCDGAFKLNFLEEEAAKLQAVQAILDLLAKMSLKELRGVLLQLKISKAMGED